MDICYIAFGHNLLRLPLADKLTLNLIGKLKCELVKDGWTEFQELVSRCVILSPIHRNTKCMSLFKKFLSFTVDQRL